MTHIINILILALKSFRRNILLNLFIIFQISLSVCITYLVYNMVMDMNELPRVYKNYYNSGIHYIAPRMDYGTYRDLLQEAEENAMEPYADILNSSDIAEEELSKTYSQYEKDRYDILSDAIPDLINRTPNLEKIYSYNRSDFITDNVNNVIFISQDTAKSLNYRMQSGQWLSDTKKSTDHLNLVVNSMSTYNVNDKLKLLCYCTDGTTKEVDAVIVGKTKEKCFLSPGMTVGGSFSFSSTDQLDSIISQSTDFVDSPFMCISDEYSDKLLEGVIKEQEQNFIIELKKDLSEEEYKRTKDFFQDNGIFFLDFDDLYNNSRKEFHMLLKQKAVLIGCSVLISFIGLISFIILIIYKETRIKKLYSIVGMNNTEYHVIYLFYTLIMIALSLLVFILFLVILGLNDYNNFITSGAYNYFVNNGITFNVHHLDFVNIPYKYILSAFVITIVMFGISALISYLIVLSSHKSSAAGSVKLNGLKET